MRVSFLFPRFIYRGYDPPMGIGYLASSLRRSGFEDIEVLDGTFQSWEECLQRATLRKPDILGVSVQTVYAQLAFRFAEHLKKSCPDTMVVFGGPHPTILPQETMQNPFVDIAVLGEGEHTIVELARGKELKDIPGIAYRGNAQIIVNPRDEPVKNLDELPFPAWDLLPMQYFKYRNMTVIASRGCPFNCSFCQPSLSQIFSKKARFRSPENMLQEIKLLKERYGVNFIVFHDDTFTLKATWVISFCQKLVEENVNIEWAANTRADLVDRTLLQVMKSAGCQQLCIGVESGDPIIRNAVLGKNLKDEHIIESFKLGREIGISCYALLMVGSPGETKASITKTLELLDKIKPRWSSVYVTTPLPGTHLHALCQQRELIQAGDHSSIDYYKGFSTLKLEHFTPSQLKKVRASMLLTCIAHRFFPLSHKKLYKLIYPFSSILEILKDFLTPHLRKVVDIRKLQM